MLHLHARRALQIAQLLRNALDQALQILLAVPILVPAMFAQRRKQRLVRREVGQKRRVGGQGLVQAGVDADAGLVGPQAGDVARGVAAAAEDEQGQAEGLDERDAVAVGADVEVEAAEPVAAERVGAALQHDGGGAVGGDAGADDVLEQGDVVGVFDAVVQRHVERVVRARVERVVGGPRGRERARAGEEVFLVVFVEGEGHDAVGGPEGLLDAVAVVDVDVDVEDAGVVAEELEDAEHDVVDVAEARGLGFLGVVQAAGPVDGDFGLVVAELARGVDGGAGVEGAVVVEAVEDGTVVADVVL